MYHLGIFREKVTLQPVECQPFPCHSQITHTLTIFFVYADYSKLPSKPNVDLVYLLDPLIATGGTANAALSMLLDWGIPGRYSYRTI